MTDQACKPLVDHLAERTQLGLVDIKFYIHSEGDATPAKVCAEAQTIFDAIKAGAVKEFKLTDRNPARTTA